MVIGNIITSEAVRQNEYYGLLRLLLTMACWKTYKWILGFQHVWDVGEKGSVGLAVGVEFLDEWIHGHNNDILIRYNSSHWGPAVRVSAHW